jgi:hypothetical protein
MSHLQGGISSFPVDVSSTHIQKFPVAEGAENTPENCNKAENGKESPLLKNCHRRTVSSPGRQGFYHYLCQIIDTRLNERKQVAYDVQTVSFSYTSPFYIGIKQ